MTHRGPFQPLLFCDSVILWPLKVTSNPYYSMILWFHENLEESHPKKTQSLWNMVFDTRFCFSLVVDVRMIPSHFCLLNKLLLKYDIRGTIWGRPVTAEELMLADIDSFYFLQSSFNSALQRQLQLSWGERLILQLCNLIYNLIFNHWNTWLPRVFF